MNPSHIVNILKPSDKWVILGYINRTDMTRLINAASQGMFSLQIVTETSQQYLLPFNWLNYVSDFYCARIPSALTMHGMRWNGVYSKTVQPPSLQQCRIHVQMKSFHHEAQRRCSRDTREVLYFLDIFYKPLKVASNCMKIDTSSAAASFLICIFSYQEFVFPFHFSVMDISVCTLYITLNPLRQQGSFIP